MSEEPYWEISGPRKYLNIPTPVPDYWRAEITYGSFPNYKHAVGWGATMEAAQEAARIAAGVGAAADGQTSEGRDNG